MSFGVIEPSDIRVIDISDAVVPVKGHKEVAVTDGDVSGHGTTSPPGSTHPVRNTIPSSAKNEGGMRPSITA
jgi:hypothetical protein